MAISIGFSLSSPPAAAGNFSDAINGTVVYVKELGGTASSWSWSFLTKPRGSSSALSATNTQEINFTPDLTGTWILKCEIDSGSESTTAYCAVKTNQMRGRLPAREETTEDTTYGWSEDLNDILRDMDSRSMEPTYIYAYNKEGSSISAMDVMSLDPVSFAAGKLYLIKTDSSFSGYNEDMWNPIGIATETIADSAQGNFLTKGFITGINTSAFSNGQLIYVDKSTGSLTATPSNYPVGVAMYSNASTGTAYFDFGGLSLKNKSIILPIEWAEDGSSPPALAEALVSGNGTVRIRKFDGISIEDVTFPWQIPDNIIWRAGLRVQVLGFISSVTPPSSVGVSFKTAMYTIGDNDPLGGTFASSTETKKTSMTYAQYDMFYTDEANMQPGSGYTDHGDLCIIQLKRDPTDSDDTYTQDVGVYGLKISWTERG